MEYLYFPEETLSQYDLDADLLNHSRISQNNRAVIFVSTQRLFAWLSQECQKQKISRYSFVLTCSYIDLFFMKKNDIELCNYQLLALGALILATKQVQTQGKIPVIDLRLFRAADLLGMQKNIVVSLDYFLNPPIYIELLNNIAKMWDMKCENGQIASDIRYFKERKDSYLRLKILYEKMDCLNLFKRILDFDLKQVVVTLFYFQTMAFDSEMSKAVPRTESTVDFEQKQISGEMQNPEQEDFRLKFDGFLQKSQINTKTNPAIISIIKLLTKEKFPINESTPTSGKTFTEMLSHQTFNKYGFQFYRKYQAQISKM